jgi:hypothetical protein
MLDTKRPAPPEPPESLAQFVEAAAAALRAQEWKIVRQQEGADAIWHLVAKKASKLRVVQVELPGTPPADRQERRHLLGDLVRMPSSLGTMEQWLAHVRPNGYVTFGPYVLSAQRWADDREEALASLGLVA